MLETLFLRSYILSHMFGDILSHMFGDKTIFFSPSPLLRTLDLTDTKSAPPEGVSAITGVDYIRILQFGSLREDGKTGFTYLKL